MLTIILIVVLLILVIFLIVKDWFRRSGQGKDNQSFLILQNQLNEIRQTLDSKVGESTKMLLQQSNQSAKIIQNVTEKLTRLDETNKQVLSFSDQLKNLQDILKNPKQRGILGEYYLETVLKNV
ncbi:MAG: DNA recombination protein RmuC, partial [Patescibacteria group bacterium]